jgi:excisionase family DNA binding protein
MLNKGDGSKRQRRSKTASLARISTESRHWRPGIITKGDAFTRLVLDINETADALRVSRSTVKRLIGEEKLKTVRVGRRILVPLSELEKLIKTGVSW